MAAAGRAALLLVHEIYGGVTVASFGSALIAALVLGLLNTLLRPILVLLTLPVTVLTSLGLFLFVINALMFYFAASLLHGFNVRGFGAALIGSLIYSAFGVVIDVAVERLFARPAERRRSARSRQRAPSRRPRSAFAAPRPSRKRVSITEASMKSTGPPLRARRWPARSRSTAPIRSPSA